MEKDVEEYIMDYLKETFNFDFSNSFVRNTFINIICWSEEHFDNTHDKAVFLSHVIDEVEYLEIYNLIEKWYNENLFD